MAVLSLTTSFGVRIRRLPLTCSPASTLSSSFATLAPYSLASRCAEVIDGYDELLARVHSLLRRYLSLGSASDNSGSLLQYYELTLNTELKKLYVRGDEIRLTATEYKIMSLLLSRPGRIFPAEEIYERVWEQDSYSVENTVMIHINRLRKKIELNPKKPEYLKVVWGIGYKIEK